MAWAAELWFPVYNTSDQTSADSWIKDSQAAFSCLAFIAVSLFRKAYPISYPNRRVRNLYNVLIAVGVSGWLFHAFPNYLLQVVHFSVIMVAMMAFQLGCDDDVTHRETLALLNAWWIGVVNPLPLLCVLAYFLVRFMIFSLKIIRSVDGKMMKLLGVFNIMMLAVSGFLEANSLLFGCTLCHSLGHVVMAVTSLVAALSIEICVNRGVIKNKDL
jgi:hypothetical protein